MCSWEPQNILNIGLTEAKFLTPTFSDTTISSCLSRVFQSLKLKTIRSQTSEICHLKVMLISISLHFIHVKEYHQSELLYSIFFNSFKSSDLALKKVLML